MRVAFLADWTNGGGAMMEGPGKSLSLGGSATCDHSSPTINDVFNGLVHGVTVRKYRCWSLDWTVRVNVPVVPPAFVALLATVVQVGGSRLVVVWR